MAKHGNNIYKRRDGRWEGRIYSGKKYRSVYARSYSEVKEKLFSLKNQEDIPIIKCYMSAGDIFRSWLEDIRFRVKDSTYYCYKTKLSKHLMPYFGNMMYDTITIELCGKFIREKLNEGFSAGYVTDMVTILKMAAKFAQRHFNFANRIFDLQPPRREKRDIQVLSDVNQKEICDFLKKDNSSVSMGILLCLYTGLRVGEICALQWKDIDFEKRILHVRKTCERIPDSGEKGRTAVRIMTPKTPSSVRQIPLPEFIYSMLLEKRSQPEHFILSGTEKCREPKFMQYRFKSILKKINLPSVRFHSLRHTFATNCLQAGFDVKTLSEIMGHANVQTTLNRYVHTSLERKCYCMSLLKMPV